MKKQIWLVVLMLAATIISSCQKGEKGDPGPAGSPGQNGTNGNANVIGTNPITIYPNNWSDDGNNMRSVVLDAPVITQDVVDKGLVMVYMQVGSSWAALPFTFSNDVTFEYGIGLKRLELIAVQVGSITGPFTFRAVIVPPSARIANPNADWQDYDEVQRLIERNPAVIMLSN